MNTAPSDLVHTVRRGCVLCCDLSCPHLGLSTEHWMGKGHSFATTRYILNGVTAWTAWGDAGRHDDSLPGVQRVWDTVNGNLSGALQDGGHGVPGGRRGY